MKGKIYERIEEVIRQAGRPLCDFEFRDERPTVDHPEFGRNTTMTGLNYVGCSEASLGRRMREMREVGRLVASRREGAASVEYSLAPKPVAVPA